MRHHVAAGIVLTLLLSTAKARWEAEDIASQFQVDGARYVLCYHADGDRAAESLGKILPALAESGKLSFIHTLTIHDLVKDGTFQKEVFEQLEKIAPETLAAARRSAGNMHNPKMEALRDAFGKAVLQTPTVTALSAVFAAHGMKISKASFEKLELENEHGLRFRCMLWMIVETANATPERIDRNR
jgi:hypothetical protein